MKFRKKQVVIEAVQWTGENVDEIIALFGVVSLHRNHANVEDKTLLIDTLEGTMMATRLDWIIKGIKGEFYPCKPDIFEVTYEPA